MRYSHGCRSCGYGWELEYGVDEEPPSECPYCASDNVYREVGSTGFILRSGGIGWAGKGSGFHKRGELHIDLGEPTPKEKATARKIVREQKNGVREE